MEILRQIVAAVVADATHPDSTGWQSFFMTVGVTGLMWLGHVTGAVEALFKIAMQP